MQAQIKILKHARIKGLLFPGKMRFAVMYLVVYLFTASISFAADMVDTIAELKQSVVGVGTLMPTRSPRASLLGTGFVIAAGNHVLTNAHVVVRELNFQANESLVVFIGRGASPETRPADIVRLDRAHDLALLRIPGPALKPVSLGNSASVREGEEVAFTGYPIGAVLGLFPVTHRGIVSAITPIVIPTDNGRQLTPKLIKRLRAGYDIFQLDATAYPGNSGSPLYRPDSGEVIGIVNMVFVKETKETVLEKPSGIAYAIPSQFALELLNLELSNKAGNAP